MADEPLSNADHHRAVTVDRRSVLLGGSAFAATLAFSAGGQARAQSSVSRRGQGKPNILFMLADNLGYGTPSCYNGGVFP
ncbi:hypothetical protein [Rhizobium sp. 768_B6_N1_8]|uniref:hypothetical protein n=1 Tax=unclassified Rhizobium TaxID=2613769 RepID=UPI003F248303